MREDNSGFRSSVPEPPVLPMPLPLPLQCKLQKKMIAMHVLSARLRVLRSALRAMRRRELSCVLLQSAQKIRLTSTNEETLRAVDEK